MSKKSRRRARDLSPAPPMAAPKPGVLERYGSALFAAALILVIAAAFAQRVAPPWPRVFPAPGEVRLFDTDPYFHLRHARFAARHFPFLQRLDPGLYPEGLPAVHAGLFDLTIAGAALVAGLGRPSDVLVEEVAAWVPPVLGALTFLALYWLASGVSGRGVGLLSVFLLLLYPGTFLQRSLLGYADHHVAEVLLEILSAGGLARCLQTSSQEHPRPWWRPQFLHALPLAVLFFTWYGAPIYLLLVGVTLLVVATVAVARGRGSEALGRAGFRYGTSLVLLLAAARLLAPWLVMEPGLFLKTLVAAVLLTVGFPLYLFVARLATARGAPPIAVALVGLGLAASALVTASQLLPGGALLTTQLLEVKSPLVHEQVNITAVGYWILGGVPALLALAALPMGLVEAWKGRDQTFRLVPVVLGALVVALWLRTNDYGYAAPPFLAFMAAFVLERAGGVVRGPVIRPVGVALVSAALILPLWPLREVVPPVSTDVALRSIMVLDEGWVQALRWMKLHTPAPILPLDAPLPPGPFRHPPGNYGVMAFWDFGHYVAAIAGRPPLAFGGLSAATASWFLLTDEEESIRTLSAGLRDGEHVRYCVVDARTAGNLFIPAVVMTGGNTADYQERLPGVTVSGHEVPLLDYGERYRRSMAARLYAENGNDLAHYRLVFTSPQRSALAYVARLQEGMVSVLRLAFVLASGDEERAWTQLVGHGPALTPLGVTYQVLVAPTVKVFEQVRGARLAGAAPPGATVEASLALRVAGNGDELQYHRMGKADAAGRFEITVSYPTESEADGTNVVAIGPYQVRAGERLIGGAKVRIDEVRAGARIGLAGTERTD